jgi:hypothetical protein
LTTSDRSQQVEGIDARGPARGQVTGEEDNRREDKRYNDRRQRVEGRQGHHVAAEATLPGFVAVKSIDNATLRAWFFRA